ncbi:MAG: hypothetical protein QOI84_211, partial [Solirubrobacterales bacterium]|nr:hypothetical protein [Solirubrobacterales bacterium]
MKRKIGSMALSLVAVLLLGGIATASASAATFAAEPSFPVSFTATGGKGTLETKAGRKVTCLKSTGSGEVSGAETVVKVAVAFQGCAAKVEVVAEQGAEVVPCQTGLVPGEITTKSIKGKPVDINAAKTEAGLLLEPEGELFAEFNCGGAVTLKVKGSIIGKVPNAQLNEFRTSLNLEFKAKKGTPEPNQVEGAGEKHVLLTKGESGVPGQSFEF